MATNATYKIWNGSQWIEYHFKTNADQVQMTTGTGWKKFVSAKVKVNGVAFGEGSENGSAEVTINGSHINWFGGTKPSTNYLEDATTTQAAIEALDRAAKSAYNHVPVGCVTYSNGGAFGTLFPDLLAIEGLSGTSGLLKKTAANTWALDTTAYVPDTRTINGKRLNANVVLTSSDILYGDSPEETITGAISEAREIAEGRAKSIGISYNYTGNDTRIKNSAFNTQNTTVTLTGVDRICYDFNNAEFAYYDLSELRIGQNIFIKELNVPDRWVSNITYNNGVVSSVEFSPLETQKVDLSNYPTKGTTLAHYGITDAKISGNTITLGSNSITVITDISGKADKNHASTGVQYGLGSATAYGHVKLVSGDLNGKTVTDGLAASQSHTHSQYLTSHQSLAEYPKIFVQNAQPTASKSGDLWIQVPAS